MNRLSAAFLGLLLLAVSATVILMLETSRQAPMPPERICETNGHSTIRIGTHSFRIPSEFRGAYIAQNGPTIANIERNQMHLTKICPEGPNSVFERKQLLITGPPKSQSTEGRSPFATTITINYRDGGAQDFEVNPAIVELEEYPPNREYRTSVQKYGGTASMANSEIFLSTDKEFTTPSGNPVGFGCYLRGFVRTLMRGRECYTWFTWGDNVYVNYSFFDKDYPTEEWKGLYKRVIDFIRNIEIDEHLETP